MDAAPPLFDAHLHPFSLRTQDLESMRFFGVRRALALVHHFPEPTAKGLIAHFRELVDAQLPRLQRAGIEAVVALGIHPRAVPRRGLNEVLAALPDFFSAGKGKVVALGEVGLHEGTEAEEEALTAQLLLARKLKLPVIVHTPNAEKERRTKRILNLIRDSGISPPRVLVDHANAKTVRPILECGHYVGLTLQPDELRGERAVSLIRKLGSERILLNSDAGDRAGDILSLARAVSLLQKAKLSSRVISRVAQENAEEFLRLRPH